MAEEQCIFCKIVKGKIPSMKVYEDKYAIAFLDINPVNPGHTLIVPKNHYTTLMDLPVTLAQHLTMVLWKIMQAVKQEIKPAGFNVINNNGKQAGQLVPHYHIHVIPRFEGDEKRFGMLWVTKKLEEEQMKNLQKGINENISKL